MRSLHVEFRGSSVLLDLATARLPGRQAFAFRHEWCSPDAVVRIPRYDAFARPHECCVDISHNPALLRVLSERIGALERSRLWTELFVALDRDQPTNAETLERFDAARADLLDETENHDANVRENIRNYLSIPRLSKKLKKLSIAAAVLTLRLRYGFVLRAVAKKLRLSETSVPAIWRRLKNSGAKSLVDLHDDLTRETVKADFLRRHFEMHANDPKFSNNTLRQNYHTMLAQNPTGLTICFSAYYAALRNFGFKHVDIRYGPKPKFELPRDSFKNFADLFLLAHQRPEKFEMVFVDESAVAPTNFKRRQWRVRGGERLVTPNIPYAKITMLGAMTSAGVVGAQFLTGGSTALILLNFLTKVLERRLAEAGEVQQVVMVLDNSPLHRTRDLRDFCANNGIVMLYLPPYHSALNPIEYLWEAVKRPLRSIVESPG